MSNRWNRILVNFDGFANSIFTVTVGAVDPQLNHAYYSDAGAAVLVCAPGGEFSRGVVITAMAGSSSSCGTHSTGTQVAAPLVSGAVALILEANPMLTWRDVQEILVRTAVPTDTDSSTWVTNGVGLRHSD
eukprot:4275542-Amphidinium_carterae.1